MAVGGWCDGVNGVADSVPEVGKSSSGSLLEKRFCRGEGELDRIEVRTVGRQEPQFGARPLDGLPDSRRLVGWQIIHDNDIACYERWSQHLLYIGKEGGGRSSHLPVSSVR